MKRYFFAFIAAAFALCVTAQTRVMTIKTADKELTFNVADILEITFDELAAQVDTTLFHAFDGYIIVSTAYFKDSYYGDKAKLAVYKTSEDEYIVTFSDPVWGEAVFGHVAVGRELAGEGTIRMDNQKGGFSDYAATLSGPMTTPVITIPSVMGGTTIVFHVGEAPANLQIAGKKSGSVTVMVGGQFGPYESSPVQYVIKANDDGTIDVTLPTFTLEGTVMGDLTVGSYTIANIAYDQERQAFFRDYSSDESITMHLKAEQNGTTTMDGDYTFGAMGNIELKTDEAQKVVAVNTIQPGKMPFAIVITFQEETVTR